jgi:hypothetical protein
MFRSANPAPRTSRSRTLTTDDTALASIRARHPS